MQNSSCNKLIFSSSATLYGKAKMIPIPETADIQPINAYGNTKAAVEKLCVKHDLQLSAKDITTDLLLHTTECFLTSSTREIMPVSSLRLPSGDVLRYPDGGGSITRQVIGHYQAFIDDYLKDYEHLCLF